MLCLLPLLFFPLLMFACFPFGMYYDRPYPVRTTYVVTHDCQHDARCQAQTGQVPAERR